MNGYRTVQNSGEYEYVVQKSRFIGRCFPVSDAGQAEARLERIRKEHWDATHNCYAFRIGPNAETARSSDDGEPSGTAGMPILQCMTAIGVTDALVIVTRYFGGILLGAGGLVRAYSHTASSAVRAAGFVQMTQCRDFTAEIPYPLWSSVERCLKDGGCHIQQISYAEAVRAEFWLAEADSERLRQRILNATDGKVQPVPGETAFRPIADDNATLC